MARVPQAFEQVAPPAEQRREIHLTRDPSRRPLVALCGFVGEPGDEPKPGAEVTCVVCLDLRGRPL